MNARLRLLLAALCLAALPFVAAGCGTTPKGDAGPLHEDEPPEEAGARVGVSIPFGG